MPSVFVSYSQKDEEALEQLRRHFAPLIDLGLVRWWDATQIPPGTDWEREIDKALAGANVAVLLITADYLASPFVRTKELPRILARHASGDLQALPVYLKPSVVDDDKLTFPVAGTSKRMKLTALQGFGTPKHPLSAWNENDREAELVRLARHVTSLADADLPLPSGAPVADDTREATPSPPQPGTTVRHDYDLVVRLKRLRDTDTVNVSYEHPDGRALPGDPYTVNVSAVDEIGRLLDARQPDELQPALAGGAATLGSALFALLLPDWETVLGQVHGRPSDAHETSPQPTPTHRPVRVRIATADALLSGLPWRMTTWDRHLLLDRGWTFVVTSPARRGHQVITEPTASALFIGGTADPQLRDAGSEAAKAAKDVIESVWVGKQTWRAVRTLSALRSALDAGLRPHFVYVHGRLSADNGVPSLLLSGSDGDESLPLAEFAQLLGTLDPKPAVVYLDVDWHMKVSAQALERLLGLIPLVLWRRLPSRAADSTTQAVTWLRRWLADAEDPVTAWHDAQRGARPASPETASVVLHADYTSWATRLLPVGQRPAHPRLVLDRRKPKAMLAEDVRVLAETAERRVLAFVAAATGGHSVAHFGEQVEHYLQAALRTVPLKRVRLEFPGERDGLWTVLHDALHLQLGCRDGEPTQELLRRHAPPPLPGYARRVLWLDWGVFGAGHKTPLTESDLGEWVRFAAEFLVDHCPPKDLRLMTSVSFELKSEGSCDRLLALLDSLREEDWHDRRAGPFRLSDLPALERVQRQEYFDFISTQAACEESLRQEVAKLLYKATDGHFDRTVALIEEAQKGSWYALRERLRRQFGSRKAAAGAERRIE